MIKLKPLKKRSWFSRLFGPVRQREVLDATIEMVNGFQASYVGTWQNLLNIHVPQLYPMSRTGRTTAPMLRAIPTRAAVEGEVYLNNYTGNFETIYQDCSTVIANGFVPNELRLTRQNRIFFPTTQEVTP
jgi:hypothetical protein